MTDQPTCPRCGRPIHDAAYVCAPCTAHIAADLYRVVAVAGDITLTVARMDRIEREGAAQADIETWEQEHRPSPAWLRSNDPTSALYPTSLPANLSAARVHDAAVGELSTWARHAAETRGKAVMGSGHPLAVLATFLGEQLEWLRHRQEADEALKVISRASHILTTIIDRPVPRWYAGKCTCGEPLNPPADAKKVICQGCGAEYDPDERKAIMLDELMEVWLTADQAAHALTILGLAVNDSTIRTWATAGRLAPHPESLPGRLRYRVGSIRELVDQLRADQRERALRAATRTAAAAARKARRLTPA